MSTTSIPISADLAVQLQQAAHSQGVPVEEFVAVSLEAAVRRAQPRDPLFADDATFSGQTSADLAAPPADEMERQLRALATDCGVSLSDEALSSEGLYD